MYIIKLAVFVLIVIVIASLFLIMLLLMYPWRKKIGPLLVQIASKFVMFYFRVKIDRADKIDFRSMAGKGIILVANHVSMLDIFLFSALYRTNFVSKIEVKRYPLIGWVADLIGVIFLDRSSREERGRLIKKIANEAVGRTISIFPQGTTSKLSNPLPFRRGIFKAVELNNNIIIIPLTIHYLEDSIVAWTRDQKLIDNVRRICTLPKIHVRVKAHKPITIADYKNSSADKISDRTEKTVLRKLWD